MAPTSIMAGLKPIAHPARAALLRPLLRIGPEAARLDRVRTGNFDAARADHLEQIAGTFVAGYNVMFDADPLQALADVLSQTPRDMRGFLVEGAGMGAAIRDGMTPGHRHLSALSAAHGGEYGYLIEVGAGWALARMPWLGRKLFRALPPQLFSLVLDGRGFHDTFFRPARQIAVLKALRSGVNARAYDQGIGRALWFVTLARVEIVLDRIGAADPIRRGDLLAGLGLAMAYAGPARPDEWAQVLGRFASHARQYQQGIAFAAAAQVAGGHVSENLIRICSAVLDRTAHDIAAEVESLHPKEKPAVRRAALRRYEVWRRSVQDLMPGVSTAQNPERDMI